MTRHKGKILVPFSKIKNLQLIQHFGNLLKMTPIIFLSSGIFCPIVTQLETFKLRFADQTPQIKNASHTTPINNLYEYRTFFSS